MKVCVMGLWHLGCVTAACLADLGFTVVGLDDDENLIRRLNEGYAPLFEPGLDELIQKKGLELRFTSDVQEAISDANFVWITYDTSVDENDNADVDFVLSKVKSIFPHFSKNLGVIVSSQLPVRSTRKLQQAYMDYEKKVGNVAFAYSPENLRLGGAINVFMNPDRVVFGADEIDRAVFAPMLKKISKNIEWMTIESAEMTKHAINAFLAVSATFANEIASLCEFVGADARQVARGMKTEKRIGVKAYVAPGSAIAGGTLNRDMRFLSGLSQEFSFPAALIHGALDSNERHKTWTITKLKQEMHGFESKSIGVLGLAYKPGTDTLRRSLSVELCKALAAEGASVKAFDPQIAKLDDAYAKFINLCLSFDEVFKEIDAVVVSTECPEFKGALCAEQVKAMRNKLIVDANGFLSADISACTEKVRYIVFGGIK